MRQHNGPCIIVAQELVFPLHKFLEWTGRSDPFIRISNVRSEYLSNVNFQKTSDCQYEPKEEFAAPQEYGFCSMAYPNISRTSERGDRLCSNVDLVMIHFMRRLRKVAPAQKKEAAMPEDTKEYQDLFRELEL